ncbi:hypothetical protein COCSUDRAFT_32743 [Coccomyxa subellipsoidea C-169]|uniref:Uncharacterized protein n=1 Tax=Coccomyxa subellipsoidea (strain C-169) TaxID=574566 RepID=I0Z1M0_COCSC|nr:hypothetical protein COCSUDRAFT_32743 [Coccomyxa subellipsoidea C-169]EIE24539.1 hypothetical protein COCSUDRAFT_32743 [Coccomyxa subellipsoidea C-169]|eukprot:XP_005649083.1 hypothetical protein COCSUDRAFT_32743 [Coccomyxa subellipsoidea C-169]
MALTGCAMSIQWRTIGALQHAYNTADINSDITNVVTAPGCLQPLTTIHLHQFFLPGSLTLCLVILSVPLQDSAPPLTE